MLFIMAASPTRTFQCILGLTIAFLLGYFLAPVTVFEVREVEHIREKTTDVSSIFREGEVVDIYQEVHQEVNKNISRLQYIDIDKEMPDIDQLYEKLVIVTAFSQNHFKEAQGIIGTAQRQMPGKKIVIYDIGINEDTRALVQSYCNVELRSFPYEDYPKYVEKLLLYAWKPIIINITLHEFGAIYWGDAAVRFKESLKELLPYVERHHGYMALFHSFDPKVNNEPRHQYYFTNSKMFDILGINRTQYFNDNNASPHATANRQLFINSTTVQTKIVQPLVQCALHIECISPKGAVYGHHRYDASALALLLYKNMKGEWTPENNDNDIFNKVIGMERQNGEKYNPQIC